MSVYYSAFTKAASAASGKKRGAGGPDSQQRVLSEGPNKQTKESQCVISPSLIGSLKHCLRTDDICTSSVTYYLKSVNAMPEGDIRAVVAYMRNPDLTNHQVASRIRKSVPVLPEERRQVKVKYSLTEFIMNTIDPTFGMKRISVESSDKSNAGEKKDKVPEDMPLKKTYKAKRSTSFSLATKSPKRTPSDNSASGGKSPRPASATRRASATKFKIASKKEKDEDSDEEGRSTMVEMNKLRMKVKKRHIESVNIDARRSISLISHAMELKADSEEMAEAVGLLHAFSNSDLDSILERESKWNETSSDEEGKAKKETKRTDQPDSQKALKAKKSATSSTASSKTKKGKDEKEKKGQQAQGKNAGSVSSRATSRETSDSIQSGLRSSQLSGDAGESGSGSDLESTEGTTRSKKDDSDASCTTKGTSASSRKKTGAAKRKSSNDGKHSSPRSSISAGGHSKDGSGRGSHVDATGVEVLSQDDFEDDEESYASASSRNIGRVRYMTVDLNDPYADRPKTPVAPDQHAEAQKYYETKGIANIFETFLSRLVLDQPVKPLDYLIELVGRMSRVHSKGQEIIVNERNNSKPGDENWTGPVANARKSTCSGGTWSTQHSAMSVQEGMTPVDT